MDCEEDSVTWIADGRYSGKENEDLAKEKNVNLITTALKGPKTEDIAAGHKLSEDGKRVIHCPAGHEPKSYRFAPSSNQITVSFRKEQCASCPYFGQCKAKIYKKVAKIVLSPGTKRRAKIQRFMNTEEFRGLLWEQDRRMKLHKTAQLSKREGELCTKLDDSISKW